MKGTKWKLLCRWLAHPFPSMASRMSYEGPCFCMCCHILKWEDYKGSPTSFMSLLQSQTGSLLGSIYFPLISFIRLWREMDPFRQYICHVTEKDIFKRSKKPLSFKGFPFVPAKLLFSNHQLRRIFILAHSVINSLCDTMSCFTWHDVLTQPPMLGWEEVF